MGTSVGKGSTSIFSKKHRAWKRYSMTGGACAGFSVATGAPISGILFSLEEAHQRFSPMIIIVSATSVTFSHITAELLSPVFKVSSKLFPTLQLSVLKINDIWIPLAIGVVSGLFAVLFLNYYRAVNAFFNKLLKDIPHAVKIFIILLLTLVAGVFSYDYISTGHELMLGIMENKLPILTLVLLLLVRSTLTLGANSNRITGGVFIPILTIGVVLAALFANVAESFFGLEKEYYSIILVLGITSCISGMMKMPLTAIAFSVEALGSYNNILFVITASISAFILTEIFDTQSINDTVLHNKIEEQNKNKTPKVIDTFVTVQMDSFAVGKQIRDIFWPANLFVLSIKHSEKSNAEIDEHGGKYIKANDILHIRYSTLDEELTKNELFAIVGKQDFHQNEDDNV
jgi:H+/Cl- antiporter ClcA